MKEKSKMLLRLLFEAETDIQIEAPQDDWRRYAEWLEKLTISKLNEEIIEQNSTLTEIIYKTIDMLQDDISRV